MHVEEIHNGVNLIIDSYKDIPYEFIYDPAKHDGMLRIGVTRADTGEVVGICQNFRLYEKDTLSLTVDDGVATGLRGWRLCE